MPPEPGELIHVEQTREALFTSITAWLDTLAPQLPPEASQLRALVALQCNPTMARLILIGERTGTVAEVARATAEDLPGAAEIGAAAETFIAAGMSALPEPVASSAFSFAARPGAGLVVLLDTVSGSARCVLAPRAVASPRWIELFGISPERDETLH